MDTALKMTIDMALSRTPLCAGLSETELTKLGSATREMKVGKGDIIFHRGDPCTGIHVMQRGTAKLVMTSAVGKEKIVELLGEGQSFGLDSLLAGRPYRLTAQTLSDCTLLHIAGAAVLGELEQAPGLVRNMLTRMTEHSQRLIEDVETYSLCSGKQRIVGFLLQAQGEMHIDGDSAAFPLPAHKGVIASRLNLTQEHFSRLLHEMQALDLIVVDGSTIRIPSLDRLRPLAA
jgi:CRP-like cAMP-binding protein